MDFFKMYDEVKRFESNHEKEQINKEVSSTDSVDRTEESDIEEKKEERKELEESDIEEKKEERKELEEIKNESEGIK